MPFGQIEALDHDGVQIAFERIEGSEPTFVWLGGFKSDMSGTKAQTLAEWAADTNQSFARFDYFGHGRSGGAFENGMISRWLCDTLAVLDQRTVGPLVLVGSSMGGWISLLAARARPERVKGLLLIAPAPDFTERLMWSTLTPDEQLTLVTNGRLERPSQYSPEPSVITNAMVVDGRRHLVMTGPIAFDGPIRILAGGEDPDVPLAHVVELAERLRGDDHSMQVIPDGDHRLSRPQDLETLIAIASELRDKLAR